MARGGLSLFPEPTFPGRRRSRPGSPLVCIQPPALHSRYRLRAVAAAAARQSADGRAHRSQLCGAAQRVAHARALHAGHGHAGIDVAVAGRGQPPMGHDRLPSPAAPARAVCRQDAMQSAGADRLVADRSPAGAGRGRAPAKAAAIARCAAGCHGRARQSGQWPGQRSRAAAGFRTGQRGGGRPGGRLRHHRPGAAYGRRAGTAGAPGRRGRPGRLPHPQPRPALAGIRRCPQQRQRPARGADFRAPSQLHHVVPARTGTQHPMGGRPALFNLGRAAQRRASQLRGLAGSRPRAIHAVGALGTGQRRGTAHRHRQRGPAQGRGAG
ncbi:hypothetical protein PIGHUM_04064 [Pigmentiphaga humi]|uniref:Uncharacterized protein n=1 Tax=Pigmentiphaga humi TaxID=2478468 RepID=A0A3P4B7D4_9BURK|nr:hypothetical protein PIGHUM_04064 [Pigmentiphaga humi]